MPVDFNSYADMVGYKPHREQWLFHESEARFRVPVCGRRFGKDLALDTPILTLSGWSTMAGLKVDDWVFDERGEPTKVVAKSEVMYNECYRVEFNDGTTFVAGAGHEWPVETYTMRKSRGNGRWNVKPYKVMTTEELAKRAGSVKYPDSVMVTLPVALPEQKLAIDPYVYGVWLGDGTTGQAQLTGHDDDIPTYLAEFEKVGYSLREIPSKRQGWKIVGLTKSDCLTKVVPDAYRMGSADQRLALLQGLMDTDGTVSNEQLQFDNKNKTLAELVEWLVTSLGGKARLYMNQKDEGTYWRVGFNVAFPAFRLQRKLDKQTRLKQSVQQTRRYVTSVERVETVPTQCIQVDAESHLYLAGHELVPTHNSTMAGRDLGARLFNPNAWYWIVGPTYDLAEKEFRVIWDDLIIGRKFGRDKRVKKAYNKKQGDMFIEFPWRTRLECRSARHPDTLVGEGLDGAIISEAAKQNEETWKRYIRPALSDKRGWATFPTTPEGYNWLYRMWQLGNNPEHPDYEAWSFPSWKNTEIYPLGYEDEEIQAMLRTTSKEWFDQEIGAKFSSFVGKIYGEFQETDHVRSLTFNPEWPNYITFDWGFTNPLAAIEFQVGPNDQIHVWREHYKAFTTVPEHCEIMNNRLQPEGYRIDGCFGDAADPEAAAVVGQYLAPCMVNPEAKENWREGVELVKLFLKTYQIGEDEYGTPIEEPKFFVDYSCTNTVLEFNNYKSKKPVSGNNVPEMGQKQSDHALDAIRYGLMHVFKLGATHHLSEVLSGPLSSNRHMGGMFTSTMSGLMVPAGSDAGMEAYREYADMGIFKMGGQF